MMGGRARASVAEEREHRGVAKESTSEDEDEDDDEIDYLSEHSSNMEEDDEEAAPKKKSTNQGRSLTGRSTLTPSTQPIWPLDSSTSVGLATAGQVDLDAKECLWPCGQRAHSLP
jgi:hypothetical protein